MKLGTIKVSFTYNVVCLNLPAPYSKRKTLRSLSYHIFVKDLRSTDVYVEIIFRETTKIRHVKNVYLKLGHAEISEKRDLQCACHLRKGNLQGFLPRNLRKISKSKLGRS